MGVIEYKTLSEKAEREKEFIFPEGSQKVLLNTQWEERNTVFSMSVIFVSVRLAP